MTTLLKISFAAAVIAGIALVGKKASDTYSLAKRSALRITKWGTPSIKGHLVHVPLTIQITNPTPIALNADQANVQLFFWQVDRYVKAGEAQIQNIPLNPGANEKTFVSTFDIKPILNDAISTVATLLFNRALNLRADVQLTLAGVTLPSQSFIQEINV